MRLRQVALATHDLTRVTEDFEEVFDLRTAHRDPWIASFGLDNAMLVLGDTFLEILAPVRDNTAAGRYLDRRGGDAGYMVIIQVDDLLRTRRIIDSLGIRVVNETDRPGLRGMHLHPADIGGALVALNVADPAGSWSGAGTWDEWRRFANTDMVAELGGVELAVGDPAAVADVWAKVLERSLFRVDGKPAIALDRGVISFCAEDDQTRQGVTGITVITPRPDVLLARARDRGAETDTRSFRLGGVRVACVSQ